MKAAAKVTRKAVAKAPKPKAIHRAAASTAATLEEVEGGVAVVMSVEDGPWTVLELLTRVRDNVSGAVDEASFANAVNAVLAAGELRVTADGYRKSAKAWPLSETIARVLGEAHEALDVHELAVKVIDAGKYASDAKLGVILAAMIADGFVEACGKKRDRYRTAGHAKVNETPEPVTVDLGDGPVKVTHPDAPTGGTGAAPSARAAPTVAELLPMAPRKTRRIVEHLTLERRTALEAQRVVLLQGIDRHVAEVRAHTRAANGISKALRYGRTVRTVSTATVPDYARRQLVTYDVSGPEPVEVAARPLPRKYGAACAEQAALPFGGEA